MRVGADFFGAPKTIPASNRLGMQTWTTLDNLLHRPFMIPSLVNTRTPHATVSVRRPEKDSGFELIARKRHKDRSGSR
jgi:hypothetical protein